MAGEGQLARDVRAGLENEEKVTVAVSLVKPTMATQKQDVLDELYFGRPKRVHVKEFACLISAILLAIGAYQIYHHSWNTLAASCVGISVALLVSGYLAPRALLPVWSGWMAFATKLGHVMTFLIVSILWFLVAIPIGLLLKVIGKKVMDLSYDPSVESYWEERAEKYHDFKLLERQF